MVFYHRDEITVKNQKCITKNYLFKDYKLIASFFVYISNIRLNVKFLNKIGLNAIFRVKMRNYMCMRNKFYTLNKYIFITLV